MSLTIFIGSLMSLMMALMLAGRALDILPLNYGAYIISALLVVLSFGQIKLREIYLLSSCLALTIAVFIFVDAPFDAVMSGVAQASFLMAFMVLLSLLHEAAMTSSSVTDCGQYLTSQRAGKRYLAIFGGTNIMAVLFNLGILSILSPLIQKGLLREQESSQITALKERRQISAMLLGFAWCVVWSPTAIAPLALYELIEGIDRQLWTYYGLAMAVIVCFIGWMADKVQYQALSRRNLAREPVAFPLLPFMKFVVMLALLFVFSASFSYIADDSFVFGLLLSCPIIMVLWFFSQAIGFDKPSIISSEGSVQQTADTKFGYVASHILHVNNVELAKNLRIVVTLAASGYIGRMASFLLPAEKLATMLNLFALPDYILLSCLTLIMIPVSFLGVSPIMMAVFFGSLLGALPVLPADPTLIALAITAGWAVSMTLSPFSTIALMTARLNDKPPSMITFGWHIPFNLACVIFLFLFYYLVTAGS